MRRAELNTNGERGFTLIELLVTAGIFIVIMTAVLVIFLRVSQTRAALEKGQVSMEDMRLSMDRISRDVRNHAVNYCGGKSSISQLALFPAGGSGAITYSQGGDGALHRIEVSGSATTDDVILQSVPGLTVHFDLTPTTNPYTSSPGTPSHRPPTVTITAQVSGTVSFSIETSATSRLGPEAAGACP